MRAHIEDAGIEADEKPLLPFGIDLQEVQQAEQYQSVFPDHDTESPPPIVNFEDDPTDTPDRGDGTVSDLNFTPLEATMLPPQSRRPPDDKSELLPQHRIPHALEDPDPFVLALGLWCEESGISRQQYTSLRQILKLLEPHPSLSRLPDGYAGLRRTKGYLPQLPLRRALVSLAPEKLATMAEGQKRLDAQAVPKEHLYFFDATELFSRVLRSQLTAKMYFGIGEFRTSPHELWQSQAWLSSVRTTSGQFARYHNSNRPIFPSDWVLYESKPSASGVPHPPRLGRVVALGYAYRDNVPEAERGSLKVKVKHSCSLHDIPIELHRMQYFARNELLLLHEFSYISAATIVARRENVFLSYSERPAILPQWSATDDRLYVRGMVNSKQWLQPLYYSAPLRAELELQTYGRNYFESHFDASTGSRCLSLPLLTFADGFGLYRNTYRTLMGLYLLFAGLTFHERNRRANVFPITLGPHGSNFNEIIDTLHGLRHFDKGCVLDLPQPTRVCAFTLAFLGDMPQQAANAGSKSQRTQMGCRFCMVGSTERGNLEYDITRYGRYHMQTLQLRNEMSNFHSAAKKTDFAKTYGLLIDPPALFKMTPALDVIVTRPSDPAHSEYSGLCKLFHQLLLESMLTPAGVKEYATAIQKWPFAPGYARLQSPVHHLKSYSLSDHARWIVIVPGLARCWLSEKHLQVYFLEAIRQHLRRTTNSTTATNLITKCFAKVARSTSLLMGEQVVDRDSMMDKVKWKPTV